MRQIKVVIAFQGTRYSGWQSQRNGKTLQEVFESALSRVLSEKVHLRGSSRTDAGVHAKAFVAHFSTKSALVDEKIKQATNHYLPQDAVILSAKTVKPSFHAQYSAKSKTYRYEIWNSRTRPSYDVAPFVLWMPPVLNVPKMRVAAKYLIGEHDFRSFRDSVEEEKNPVRRLRRLTIQKKGPKITLTYIGDGFLRHMIRVITGTLIEVGRGKIPAPHVKTMLAAHDRRKAGPTAKPQGLTLLKVHY